MGSGLRREGLSGVACHTLKFNRNRDLRGVSGQRAGLALACALGLVGCGQSVREAIAPRADVDTEASPEPEQQVEALAVSAPSPPAVAPAPAPAFAGWVMAIDYGIRADKAGQGQFLAPRYHGKHNGVDLLAPIGTPVLAACSGKATHGVMGGYGKWVKLVCRLPSDWADGYLSLFYSHLSEQAISGEGAEAVELGEQLGKVGKSGNAAGASVMPHLHLELIVHASERAALQETHSGRDQSNDPAADQLAERLGERCLEPLGLKARAGLRRERRLDPYLVLGCLGAQKPQYQPAPGALRAAGFPWREHYEARGVDPNVAPFVVPGDPAGAAGDQDTSRQYAEKRDARASSGHE